MRTDGVHKRDGIRRAIRAAFDFRNGTVSAGQTVFRLCAGRPDGLDGLIIDRLGGLAWIRCYSEEHVQYLDTVCDTLRTLIPGVRCFASTPSARTAVPVFDPVECSVAQEYEAQDPSGNYLVAERPADDFGLYVDASAARNWVVTHAQGCRVLNLYAYTCGFSVAALRAGASAIWNVDVSRDYLTWGRRNAQLNGADFAVYPDDCLEHLRRRVRRAGSGQLAADAQPDLVILDPPAFLKGRGSERLTRNVIHELLDLSLAVCSADGTLLVSCNDAYQNREGRFTDVLHQSLSRSGLTLGRVGSLEQSPDVIGRRADVADLHHLPSQFWLINKH
jgi:23S rRNA G2069 N7-methylase RlmK/C1962 C5-methylase RlmI